MTGHAAALDAPGRRDLVLTAVVLVGLSRLVDGPVAWLVAGLVLVAMLLGTLQVLADAHPPAETTGVPIESLLTPAVAAIACVGAIRLVPVGPALVPALALAGLLVDRTVATEARILASPHGATPADRTVILVQAVVVAFLAFSGVAALVPHGLAEPPGPTGPGTSVPQIVPGPGASAALPEADLLLLAAADAFLAGLLGYRVSALRMTSLRDALWSAATYASIVAIGAAALRAMVIPRLVGPALLTLIFFLWDAFHGAPPRRRREAGWIWQTLLLVVLGAVVIGWNLLLR